MNEIKLNDRYTAIVDEDSKALGFKWSAHVLTYKTSSYVYGRREFMEKDGYPQYVGKKVLLHRFIMEQEDPEIFIDHINRNTLDNRKENLRFVSRSQNARNNNTKRGQVGKIGVYVQKNRFIARHKINCKLTHIGSYKTIEEAAHAYDNHVRTTTDRIGIVNYPIEGDANYLLQPLTGLEW